MALIPGHLNITIINEAGPVSLKIVDRHINISAFHIKSSAGISECVCLQYGKFTETGNEGILVRVHSSCLTSEVFRSSRCDCAWQLENSLRLIEKSPPGVIIYLTDQEGRGHGLLQKIKSFRLMDEGLTTFEAFKALGLRQDARDYIPAFALLFYLGVTRIKLITNNPVKVEAAQKVGLDVVERVPSVMATSDSHLLDYLKSKALQFQHIIEDDNHG